MELYPTTGIMAIFYSTYSIGGTCRPAPVPALPHHIYTVSVRCTLCPCFYTYLKFFIRSISRFKPVSMGVSGRAASRAFVPFLHAPSGLSLPASPHKRRLQVYDCPISFLRLSEVKRPNHYRLLLSDNHSYRKSYAVAQSECASGATSAGLHAPHTSPPTHLKGLASYRWTNDKATPPPKICNYDLTCL